MPVWPERRRAPWVAALGVVVALAGGAAASASMTAQTTAAQTVATALLQPPTSPATATGPCTVAVSASVTLSWTPTASTWADGYEVLYGVTSGGPYLLSKTVAGRSSSGTTVTALAFATRYYFVVRATKGAWQSAPTAQVSHLTPSALCT